MDRSRIDPTDWRSVTVGAHVSTLWISLPVVALGAWLIAVGLGLAPTPSGRSAPSRIVTPIGGAFLLAGLGLASTTILGLRRAAWIRRRQAEYPDAPWLADHPWDPDGVSDRAPQRILKALFWLAFLTCFLGPFLHLAFFSGERMPWFVRAGIGLFGLALVLPLRRVIGHTRTLLRFGRTRLRFQSFPFTPDGEVDVTFATNSGDGLAVTLRYVEERIESRQVGGRNHFERIAEALYTDHFEVTCSPADPEVRIRRHLPGRMGWTTRLSAMPVRYWEMRIESADRPGLHATYALPVYAGPTQTDPDPRRAPQEAAQPA